MFGGDPARYVDRITEQIGSISPSDLQHIFHPSEPNEAFNLITITEPGPGSRSVCRKRAASRPAFEIVWDHRIRHRVSDMRYQYNVLRLSPDTTPAANWAFELRMHDLLRRGNPIRLTYQDLQLPQSEERPLDKGGRVCIGRYYRLQATDASTINSLFFFNPPGKSSPILLAFQITRDEECHINEETLRRIDGLDLSPHTNVRKFFVVVTPDDIQPKIEVPNALFGGTVIMLVMITTTSSHVGFCTIKSLYLVDHRYRTFSAIH